MVEAPLVHLGFEGEDDEDSGAHAHHEHHIHEKCQQTLEKLQCPTRLLIIYLIRLQISFYFALKKDPIGFISGT